MMVRAQIAIDKDLKRRATERARESGLSFTEYVVRLIEKDLALQRPKIGVEAVFNLGSSDASDIARNKKQMIGEAVAAWHRN